MVNTTDATTESVEAASPSPFHAGEQRVQTLTGAREISEQLGRSWHSKSIQPAAAKFLEDHQLLYTASRNKDGRLWASVLAGPLGFLQARNPTQLVATPMSRIPGDPAELNMGDHIGTLAIKLETRQRERVNGVVSANKGSVLGIEVQQSFSGCPKYIQARAIKVDDAKLQKGRHSADARVSEGDEELLDEQRDFVERADTLFLASCYYGALDAEDGVVGCDVSHRGGPPGFVQVSGLGTLRFADYIGNFTFTTLGNIDADPRASIHILDYTNGDSLQMSGTCKILWDDRELPGAQRTLEFVTEKWVHVRKALPFLPPGKVRWSVYNPQATSTYSDGVGKDRLQQLVNEYIAKTGANMLRCLSTKLESPDVKSYQFELKHEEATDEGNMFADPGQFASFDFENIKPGETINRTWTISSPQHAMKDTSTFTITVKKAGLVSNWLFDNMTPGRTICFRGVDGNFTLGRLASKMPLAGLLLIGGGIGITPMRTMFHHCITRGIPVTLLYSVRRPEDAIFGEELIQAAEENETAQFAMTVTSQQSLPQNGHSNGTAGKMLAGRITAEMIQKVCGDVLERAVFQCGPTAMMKSLSQELEKIGFPMANLHHEEFLF